MFMIYISLEIIRLVYLIYNSQDYLFFYYDHYYEINFFFITMLVYFVYDLCELFIINRDKYTNKDRFNYLIHHSVSIISILFCLFGNPYYSEFVLKYFTYEISTPFLNESQYYRKLKIRNKYTLTMNCMFFITYTLIRILYGSYLTYETVLYILTLHSSLSYLIILPLALQFMIFNWYVRILKICRHTITNKEGVINNDS